MAALRLFLLLVVASQLLESAQQEQTVLATHPSIGGCTVGAYKVSQEPYNGCSGWRSCGAGHYCVGGARLDCPAGSYGASEMLSNSTCNGLCSAGYWCRSKSTSFTENKCGNYTHYCPAGSSSPIAAPDGFYTVNGDEGVIGDVETRSSILVCPIGHYCKDGLRALCPAGTFGSSEALSSSTCSGECAAGWYCPEGSTSSTQEPCDASPLYYCPAGSGRRLPVAEAHYADGYFNAGSGDTDDGGFSGQKSCPAGSFCLAGVRELCAPGRFGSKTLETNSSCSGECVAGYYCPAGSISPKQQPCGAIDVYCPSAAAEPVAVSEGHYTFSHLNGGLFDDSEFNNYANTSERDSFKAQRQTGQRLCEKGHYCEGNGKRNRCPAGRYGSREGETSSMCSGPCAEGFYCPDAGSTSPTEQVCSDVGTFCMAGSVAPLAVSAGYYTLLGAGVGGVSGRAFEHKCEPGFYCSGGVRISCPKGVFGSSFGLTNESCSGYCSEGYYCPEGSMSSTEVECGNHNLYCPGEGNWRPTRVGSGYYTTGGNYSTRTGVALAPAGSYAEDGLLRVCRAGYFGATAGLSSATCSGPCSVPGYYCPAGSTSPTMRVCGGDSYICPAMSTAPIKVLEGHYTADYTHEGCAPGYFRNWTLSKDSTHHASTYNSSLLADPTISGEPLHFLPSERSTPPCELCPDGTFKSVKGDSISLCRSCNNTQQNKLAVSTDDRVTCRCSKGLADPETYLYHFNVITGKCVQYSVESYSLVDSSDWAMNTSLTRYRQTECEPGYYCVDGERFICPAGRFGAHPRETRSTCSGGCAAGYFCPMGSTSAYQNVCGARNLVCPAESSVPQAVGAGSYTVANANPLMQVSYTTCEPGFYCPGDGLRYECPAGSYGDSYGLSSPDCSGLCTSGYYCSSASTTATQNPCGNATVYCPRGSVTPKAVHAGFYTINTGDDASAEQFWDSSNSTRSAEVPCEPGYYCFGGVKQPCGPGTFGWRYGMTGVGDCQLCAKGYYCPSYLQPQPDAPSHTVWPGKPHTKADELECGSVGFYCPAGSFFPAVVGSGNFSTGGDSSNRTRTGQEICRPGYFCSNGIALSCPKGKYGSTYGLSQQVCTDWCPPAKYCPEGTAEPISCPHNHYAQGAVWLCSECPATRSSELSCQDKRSCCFME